MKSATTSFRNIAFLALLVAFSAALIGCGGGGGGTSGLGAPGASVGVSVAAASSFPSGTVFSTSSAAAAGTASPAGSSFDHVWVKVTKIALIPTKMIPEGERGGPDRDGEVEVEDIDSGEEHGFVTAVINPPVTIDLLQLPGTELAMLLNRFSEVPAGSYGKIRLFYSEVSAQQGTAPPVMLHPTGHFHLDIHFVGGNLVVPVSTDPDAGIRFFNVTIQFVSGGLKIIQNPNKVLLRPQVFATVSAPVFSVSGTAQDVHDGTPNFTILTAEGRAIAAAYQPTTKWFFRDGREVSAGSIGAKALRNTAFVEARGLFSSTLVLMADSVFITFPAQLTGRVFLGWNNPVPNTFTFRFAGDNVIVPEPDRFTAIYDNAMAPHAPLTQSAIADNVLVTARGYGRLAAPGLPGGVDAFWISVGP